MLLEATNDVAQRALTVFRRGCARIATGHLPGGAHAVVVIGNDRDVHGAATLRRSAQFSQHQGLKLHPCLRRLVHHQDTRETQFGNQPVRVSVRSKDTPSSCPSGSSFASEDHRQLAERCIRLAKECTKPSVAEYLMTLAANYLELAERALRLYEPATAARRQHIKVMQKE